MTIVYRDALGRIALGTHAPAHERFWAKVDKNGPLPTIDPELGPCWIWTGSTALPGGYGAFMLGTGKPRRAHRVSYEWLVGPIPDGLHLDHLCVTTPCVNPAHLEPVTNAENVRREADRRRRAVS